VLGVQAHERIAGFVHLGTAKAATPERVRAEIGPRVRRWTGA
jgi:hypothetical protein